MSAGVVTSTRVLSESRFPYSIRWGLAPTYTEYRDGSPFGGPMVLPDETQETTSYRTVGGADSEDQEVRDARRIFRNGFTTYDPTYDHGHEFFTTRTARKTSHPHWEGWRPEPLADYASGYKGPLWVTDKQGNFPDYPSLRRISDADIRSFGARAISACSPTNPQANLTTLLGEVLLDGGLPHPGAKAASHGVNSKSASDAAGDYLNVQFGWVPLVSDVLKIIRSLKGATASVKQLVRDSGRNVRRGFSFPEITDVQIETNYNLGNWGWYNVPQSLNMLVDPGKPWVHTKMISRKRNIWFKGSFTYHIEIGNDLMNKLERFEQEANLLLGTRLNASAAWELTPWSWLVDWQSTIGVALGNASNLSEDGLVIRYGYLMSHTVDTDIYTTQGITHVSGGFEHTSSLYSRETKERVRATPFGFGLDLSELTAKQWSILVALGMTRGNDSLRLTS